MTRTRVTRAAAVALALAFAATEAPAANAIPADQPANPWATVAAPDLDAPTPATRVETPAERVVDDGFNWGDAGIGAGAAIPLVLVAGGSVLLVRRRQTPARS